jgi:ankyrin repeat protein
MGVLGWLIYIQTRQEGLNRALIAAIKRQDTPTALSLLEQGADANAHDESQQTPVSWWQLLLDKLHTRHALPPTAPTALLVAFFEPSRNGDYRYHQADSLLIEALLNHGADINAQDENGGTALIYAAEFGHVKAVRLLLDHHADVNIKDYDADTALSFAQPQVFPGQASIMHLLKQAGAKE